jgi:hypothetical protein
MLKKIAIGATALTLAGSALVYAQQRPMMPERGDMRGWHASAEDMSAFADARIAALHAGLKLNADQEKSWPPVEQALRDLAKQRIDRINAVRNRQEAGEQGNQHANPIERLQRRADALSTRGAALKRLADAAAPLYQSLDESQKRRFALLSRVAGLGREGFHHHGFREGREGFRGREDGMRGMHGMGRMHDMMRGMGGGGMDQDTDHHSGQGDEERF